MVSVGPTDYMAVILIEAGPQRSQYEETVEVEELGGRNPDSSSN
jgi:hypothetical protein